MSSKTKSNKKKSHSKTLKTKLFKTSLSKLPTDEILSKTYTDLEDALDLEEKTIEQMKPKLMKDLKSIEQALIRNKNGGYIIFGDPHHGDLVFDLLLQVYPNLSAQLKEIIDNAYFFSENKTQMKEIIKKKYGKKHLGLDDESNIPANYDELKRNYSANTEWTKILKRPENINKGIHIISVGRAHLYSIKAKKDSSKITKVISFQDTLKKEIKKTTTVFAMNSDANLNYDDYNAYSKTHQLDVVTNNPKIRTIYLP